MYGSSDLGLAEAIAYRDAVIAALPPRTNNEQSVLLKSNNRSGISGVRYAEYSKGPFWMAMIETKDGRKSKSFSVRKYGYDQAKSRAIAQRQAWLAQRPISYVPTTEYADSMAKEQFAFRDDSAANVLPYKHLPDAEVKSRIEAINAHFDSLRPRRFHVRVRCYRMTDLAVYVSDVGRPARSKQVYIGIRRQTLETALAKAAPKVEGAIADFYDDDVSKWFMIEHGSRLLDVKNFDPGVGFSQVFFVPTELKPVGAAS